MSEAAHLLRLETWRHLVLVVTISLLPPAASHYVDTTGEVPAWTIESLTPQLDKIAFPDNTLDSHHPYVAKPDVVYPSPQWTFEVYKDSNNIKFPTAPKIVLPTKLKNQNIPGIQSSRPSFPNPKFANAHTGPSDHNWSVEIALNQQFHNLLQSQQFSGSSPILRKQGPKPHSVGALKKNYVKPLHVDFDFHYSFEDPNFSGRREQNPFLPYMLNNQKEILKQERLKKLRSSTAISEINLHESISDTSAMTKHETEGYKTPPSFIGNQARNSILQRNNFKSLGPFQIKLQGFERQTEGHTADRKRKRDVSLEAQALHGVPSHHELPWTYHDNLPQRIRKDHVNAGQLLEWQGSESFARSGFQSPYLASAHRDNANIFLPPIVDILVDEADYDYISSLTDKFEGSFNTGQKHHVHESPLTYHAEQIFGELGGVNKAPSKAGFSHYDSSTLDLDYNVQYDFGIAETLALKGDAAIVNPGSGFAGHSGYSFGQFESSDFGGSGVHSSAGGQVYSSRPTQSGSHDFGSGNKGGHKLSSGATKAQFHDHNYDSGYDFISGHGTGASFGSKDTIIQSVGHGFGSGDGNSHSGGDQIFDSGDLIYFDQGHNSGSAHFNSKNKFGHTKGPSFGDGDTFTHSGGSDVDAKNKFVHSEGSKFNSGDKFIDSLEFGFGSRDKFFHFGGQGFGSGDKFVHSRGPNVGSGDEFIHSGKSSFVSTSHSAHSGGSSFSSKDNSYQIGDHGFSSLRAAHPSKGIDFKREPSLSHSHQGSQDFKDVLSMFRPVGHDFGPADVQSTVASLETAKRTSDPNFFDNASSKLISRPKHLNGRPSVPFSRADGRRFGNSFSEVQEVSKRSVGSSLDDNQPLYVEASLGETLPSNFYGAQPVASKEELPDTFFIAPEKLELSDDERSSLDGRNIFFSRGSESTELEPTHLLTPSSYDHDSGFDGLHKSNLTVISVPKGSSAYGHEHGIREGESISPIPKGFKTYVHEPPNSDPNLDDRMKKNEFTQSVESSPNDYVYSRQANDHDQIVPRNAKSSVTGHDHATHRVRSSSEDDENVDDYYYEGDDSETEYKDTYSDGITDEQSRQPEPSDEAHARHASADLHRHHNDADQQPSEDGNTNVAYYYDDEYYSDK